MEITGEIVKVAVHENMYGESLKMTLKTPEGYLVWGTVPKALDDPQRGDKVTLTATLTPSPKDPKFGFFKRPHLTIAD